MPGPSRIVKHTVVSSGLHDADIRPPDLLEAFKQLSLRDAAALFGAPDALEQVPCPACGADAPAYAFEKDGYHFQDCGQCQSRYVSPRPRADALKRYHAESEASRFRASRFAEGAAAQRRHHLLRANAAWIARVAAETGLPQGAAYADCRTYAPELFDEIADLGCFGPLYAIAPWNPVAGRCKTPVAEAGLDTSLAVDAISAFEKLEHQHAPLELLHAIATRLNPGGLLFLTTRTCSGFDLQILAEKAPYIFVPEHLNLLSITGLERLAARAGFEIIELSTPGQLDVELVAHACAADPSIVLQPFIQTLIADRGPRAHADFQEFLQKHRLSSHVRIALKKANP